MDENNRIGRGMEDGMRDKATLGSSSQGRLTGPVDTRKPTFGRRREGQVMIRAACGCNVGKHRSNNEDNFYFDGRCLDANNSGLGQTLVHDPAGTPFLERHFGKMENVAEYYAVFDGMGGGDYGEVASNLAATTARELLRAEGTICPYDVSVSLVELTCEMSRRVFLASVDLGAGQMGSTAASLLFYGGYAWVCNVGDSRCYRLRADEFQRLSVDHTDENEMRACGVTGRKPRLTQYLGVDPDELRIEPYVHRHTARTGDRFLLCSDGLTDMVDEAQIADVLASQRDPAACVEQLIVAALDAGGADNVTVVACFV